MNVRFADHTGKSGTVEWLNNETGRTAFLADSEQYPIIVREMGAINRSAYGVIGNEEDGYLVKVRTLSNASSATDYSADRVVFENVLDSTQSWEGTITSEGAGTVSVGGQDYAFTYLDNRNGNDDATVRLNWPESSGNNMIVFPTVETSKGAKLAFYEPQTIDLSNFAGAGAETANVTGLMLPDGDGYTTVTVSRDGGVAANPVPSNYTITFGSSTAQTLRTNVTKGSVDGAIGSLTYNLTTVTGVNTNNTVKVYLEDPSSGLAITNPAIVLFEEQDESNNYQAVVIETAGAAVTSAGVGVSDIDFSWNGDADMSGNAYGAAGFQQETNTDMYEMMDQWGTLVTTDESNSDQYTTSVSYPDNQVTVLLYVDGLGAAGGTGSTTLGDVKVMDSELASSGMQAKNLVVVGGSCVNTVASTLLGGSAGCGASWTAATGAGTGEWIIQTLANPWASSKVATLVAGWEQADTANAATYLTTQNPMTTVGTKLKGTTSSAATTVTS
jgi:hypothetical protein